ncbi:MAG TPA: aminodeoxychorismate synthase component I [Bacillales bacterium]|nr:aminodeoxychorismate synthase component I [Bacillales bacterium]
MFNQKLFFEFADQPLLFENPIEIIEAYTLEDVKAGLEKVQRAARSGYYAAGYVSYEAAPAFDSAFIVHGDSKMPLLWFGIFKNPSSSPELSGGQTFKVGDWLPDTTVQQYHSAITDIKSAIENGDTYQVNYTIRLRSDFEGDDFSFYRQLSKAQSSNYSAYLNTGKYRILSASPELFFHWKDGEITTRPMKGTCKRGRWYEEDEANAQWLYHSEKNRAENVMIVDLLRNDLGATAIPGSVKVPKLFEIEKYPTVLQMTSTITAKTNPETTLVDVFSALFPCGSITGAPKISTMKIISSLEDSPREVYCGAIGYITPDQEAIFNVPIRTTIIDAETGKMEYSVGGGITWDSEIEDEYEEALTKAMLLTATIPEFDLLESLRLENGKYGLLDRHLQRLQRSADYFGFDFSDVEIQAKLAQYAKSRIDGVEKVRLVVRKDGVISLDGSPLATFNDSLPICLADKPISNQNRFLYHKTTYRKMYEEQRARHPDEFDVLLWNEAGELTEFTIGNLVMEIGSQLYTPPVECGLLPGTMREALLAEGKIKERILTKKDLAKATQIWLINSVRGWVPVYLINKY